MSFIFFVFGLCDEEEAVVLVVAVAMAAVVMVEHGVLLSNICWRQEHV